MNPDDFTAHVADRLRRRGVDCRPEDLEAFAADHRSGLTAGPDVDEMADRFVDSLAGNRRFKRKPRGLSPLGWGLFLLGYGVPALIFGVVVIVLPGTKGQYPEDPLLYALGWIALDTGALAVVVGLFLTSMEILARLWVRRATLPRSDGVRYAPAEASLVGRMTTARARAALLVIGLGLAAVASFIIFLFTAFPERSDATGKLVATYESLALMGGALLLMVIAWRIR